MKHHGILSENSEHHWPFLNTNGKVLLDLGCGRHGTADLYQSSAVYLGELGATKVIALDGRESEIEYFNSTNINPDKYTFMHKFITSSDDVLDLISVYNPTAIKCDIEGYETAFYNLTADDMSNVEEIAIEYHDYDIQSAIKDKLNEWGFEIHTEAKFTLYEWNQESQAPQMGVFFSTRKK
jgi:2-polyprenyl-3-methyl-5-hydroxy-6-metoxy-1,4-benzoquinol methylase